MTRSAELLKEEWARQARRKEGEREGRTSRICEMARSAESVSCCRVLAR